MISVLTVINVEEVDIRTEHRGGSSIEQIAAGHLWSD